MTDCPEPRLAEPDELRKRIESWLSSMPDMIPKATVLSVALDAADIARRCVGCNDPRL